VKTQALQSEAAVIEITRDMKRLDYAKRHLQRTITALKRLHMLLHAAEQLRVAATIEEEGSPIPNYKAASQLIDATRLLLGHFDGYMNSVPKMRQVRDAIGMLNSQLREGAVNLFHEVGFQQPQSNEGEEEETAPMVVSALSDACLVMEALGEKSKHDFVIEFISDHLEEYELLYSPFPVKKKKGGNITTTSNNSKGGSKNKPPPPGSPPKSFKKASSQSDDVNESPNTNSSSSSSSSSSLDQVEQRFAWYRSKLRTLQLKFTNVFPLHWNLYYHLTVSFLERTARHLKFVLKKHSATVRIAPFRPSSNSTKEGGGGGDLATSLATPSMVMSASAVTQAASKFGMSVNSTHGGDGGAATAAADGLSDGEKAVTALLKALQRTILFEKEMSAWLSRDFGTQFVDPSEVVTANDTKKKRGDDGINNEEGGEEEALEFDDQGRAVAAGSAEGIRIKYERRKRMGGGGAGGSNRQGGSSGGGGVPVPQLMGIASVTFDNYMSPYVALEERTMDEQLHAALADTTVDNRGAQPVFVSSTNLFIYMKNSITRCTALTKEKTFFLLQRAFQKKLQSYAKVLDKKLPQPQTQIAAKMASLVDSTQATNTFYRIPPGQEVTVCYVIDTCEYCADTVEALEDLIRDKIGTKYQDKIDMSEEQDAFQDVTAKCIRVLVSGLEQRLDAPLKDLSRTNWSLFDMVGEESSYVRTIQVTIHPFVTEVRQLIPSSYFRSFCDKFAMTFASTYYRTLTGLKRISEAGTQQLLLDVTTIKSLLLKLPVLEAEKKPGGATRHSSVNQSKSLSGASTIAPAMYTKMVNKEFRKLEVMLKLVGSPKDMLVDMFRAQWDSSIDTSMMASDFQTIMNLKGIPRNDHASMLESLGVEAVDGRGGADSSMTVNIQALQEKGSDVAAKVNADLDQMRQRVDRFRNAFR